MHKEKGGPLLPVWPFFPVNYSQIRMSCRGELANYLNFREKRGGGGGTLHVISTVFFITHYKLTVISRL